MDCVSQGQDLKGKHAAFLGGCFRVLQGDLCGGNPDKIAFYINCITHLGNHGSLNSAQMRECDKDAGEDAKRTDKTYRQWFHALAAAIEANQNRLQNQLSGAGLSRFPKLEYVPGVKGRPAYFHLTPSPSEDAAPFTANGQKTSADAEADYSTIRYKTEKISRPPWYLKATNSLFKSQKTRVAATLALLAGVFLVLPIAIASIYLYQPNNPLLVGLFAILLTADLFLIQPTLRILRLNTRKITLVDSLTLPLSSVCISEISGAVTTKPAQVGRRLSVVTVAADCPICSTVYGLQNSVLLEQRGLFHHRIIGVCSNNPMMHRFTFDKDLMAGERLHRV